MVKRSTWDLEDWILLVGGIWLLNQVFKTAQTAGIGSLPEALRNMYPYVDNDGKRIFDNELKKLTNNEQGEVIRLIIESRLKPSLRLPVYKRIIGYKYIDSEFIRGQWRIFAKRLPNGDFVMLTFFKKQSNETPREEIIRAENRGKEAVESKRYF